MKMNDDRGRIVNRVLALFVFVVVLVVYVRTMAASVSFWDCGEFIACAHILGIPHPPGAPLHGLLGRLFSLLPLFGAVARRLNFLSALTGALAAGVLYLVTERVARGWFGVGFGWRGRLLGMVGGVAAGLFMAFSDTYWSNTVEAEVYAPAMFSMVLVLWLALRWQEVREQPGGDHVLLLLVYLLFLGIGIHLTAFLVAPGVFLLVVLTDGERLRDLRFWLAGVVLSIIIVSLAQPFMVAGDTVRAEYSFSNNVHCYWESIKNKHSFETSRFTAKRSPENPGRWGFDIYGTRGIVSYRKPINTAVFYSPSFYTAQKNLKWEKLPKPDKFVIPEHKKHPIVDFIHAIETDTQPQSSGYDGRWSIEMVSCVYESQINKKRIYFPLKNREHPLESLKKL